MTAAQCVVPTFRDLTRIGMSLLEDSSNSNREESALTLVGPRDTCVHRPVPRAPCTPWPAAQRSDVVCGTLLAGTSLSALALCRAAPASTVKNVLFPPAAMEVTLGTRPVPLYSL